MVNGVGVRNWAVAGTVVWFFLVITIVLTSTTSPLALSLNELGDFTAGAIAPLGVLWLVVTVYLQGAAIATSRADFASAQQDNYRLDLFDKRLRILRDLKNAMFLLNGDDKRQQEGRVLLAEAAEVCEFLLGPADHAFVQNLYDRARRIGYCDRMYAVLQPKQRSAQEDAQMQALINEGHEHRMWLLDNATDDALHAMFRPYIQMPTLTTNL